MRLAAVLAAAAAPAAAAAAAACGAATTAGAVVKGRDMTGKTVVLTGGDSGIGYQTALALAETKAAVVIASYDAAGSGASAAANITRLTGNAQVSVVPVDLSSFASVRAAAAAVLKQHATIDVVVCDAGIGHKYPTSLSPITADGFERVIQTNYLGHFLLVDLLLPALRASGAGRVITLSSQVGMEPCLDAKLATGCTSIDRLQQMVRQPRGAGGAGGSNYAVSKFIMVYYARELAAREAAAGGRVSAYALRPGIVDTPMLHADFPPAELAGICLYSGYAGNCPLPPSHGAGTPAWLASAPLPAADGGEFFFFCAQTPSPAWAGNAGGAAQRQLYDLTAQWVGSAPAPPPPPPVQQYACKHNACVAAATGSDLSICQAACGSP